METKPLHLKGLNGIRAIAALGVVISHTTQKLGDFSLDPFIFGVKDSVNPRGWDLAGYGVTMFFYTKWLLNYLSSSC